MAEPNVDGDSSSLQRIVILRDWWLIKCSKESDGKRFGVAGTESASVEIRAMRGVFTSSPIIKAFDVFTLQASDGICIILRGFLNKQRIVECGFIPEICRDFVFGFPPCWEQICNNCFRGVSFLTDKASRTILSPCKNTEENLESSPPESRDKSTVTVKNRRKLDASKNPCTNGGDHGSNVLDNAVEKDDCVATNSEVILPDSVENVASKNATKEPLTSEQRKGKLKVRKTTLHALSKGINNCSKPGNLGESKKSWKTLNSNGNVVDQPMIHSGSRVKQAEKSLTGEKTNRKIDFDFEVTPVKEVKKLMTKSAVSTDSLGQKRSRSGRVLVSSLEFWRNQIPVYDMDRNLTQVKEGHESSLTPSKVKKTGFSTAKKMKK